MPPLGAGRAGGICCRGHLLPPFGTNDVDVRAALTNADMHGQETAALKGADVLPNGAFAQSGAVTQASVGRVAAPTVVGVVCKREHHQPFGRPERLAVEYC